MAVSANLLRQYGLLGDRSEGVAPVPIPNTAVKPLSPDGTARASVWESRKSPKLNLKGPIERSGPLLFLGVGYGWEGVGGGRDASRPLGWERQRDMRQQSRGRELGYERRFSSDATGAAGDARGPDSCYGLPSQSSYASRTVRPR